MARAPEFVVDFPTLWVTADWIPQHCVVPDGFDKGSRFDLVDWQLWSLLNFYRVRPEAKLGQRAQAFHYRRGQVVLPQKAGKAPYTSAHICTEGVGPALFGGWAKGGEVWDCREYGCGCGWVYEYQPGEPMGVPWPTPLIQITATSEEQTDNIYDALRPMIDSGPLSELIPKTGEEFIRLPGDGRIDVVTSNARSRLGQRVTFVPQDETGIWTPSTGMVKVAETQRRGLAGMGGRAEETTNAYDPTEDSVAQRTAESDRPDIFRYHPDAPASLSYRNKGDRRKIHRQVYFGCHWVDLDDIEAEAAELLETDPAQAERFFGNRSVAGSGKAFNPDAWDRDAKPKYQPKSGALIVVGADGARSVDSLALIATEIETGHQWPLGIWERPKDAPKEYEHPTAEVDGALEDAEEAFDIWRVYVDPGSRTGNIEALMERWQGRYGDRVQPWYMHRPRQTAVAVANYADAIANGDVSHSGDKTFTRHIKNAVKRKVNVRDDDNPNRQLHVIAKDRQDSPRKIDGAAAGVLSWEARGDAIAADAQNQPDSQVTETPQREIPGKETVVRRGDLTLRGERYIDKPTGGRGRRSGPRRGR